ncbi:MlaD family protein [Conexibacter sp. SYSU D00693]|uniref:MlaD family protein n=1 Tax=Conexibacter sp. SYSU D00693 TaxID=2812560 RepID=UPI00196AD7E8|nr:MlaD family protein [Conexibacter sp. SYSU D00693]
MRGSRQISRVLTAAALVVAVAVLAVVVLGGGGADYRLTARFENAGQLVKGNLVQVAGRAIGEVEEIRLGDDGGADVHLRITDEDYVPLRAGVQAVVRQTSLSGVANRYVDLQMPPEDRAGADLPDGGRLPAGATTSAVDLDQLFNTFDPRSRKALQRVVQGFGASYAQRGDQLDRGLAYLEPSLSSSSRLFDALAGDQQVLDRFVTASAKLVTDVAARRDDVRGLVDELATTTKAIGDRGGDLRDALSRLPPFLRRSNTTFVNLRAALRDLEPLVDDARPVAPKLRRALAELRPAARDAAPALRDLDQVLRRDGAANDLVDLVRSTPALRDVAVGPTIVGGVEREGALPASTKALERSAPLLATARPYAPDLTGWFDDFSHSGVYDALGGGSRAAASVNLFAVTDGTLLPIPPQLRELFNAAGVSTGQRWRCPGSVERGAVWKPAPDFPCDENQVPLGR